jgi:hypothetical protein
MFWGSRRERQQYSGVVLRPTKPFVLLKRGDLDRLTQRIVLDRHSAEPVVSRKTQVEPAAIRRRAQADTDQQERPNLHRAAHEPKTSAGANRLLKKLGA